MDQLLYTWASVGLGNTTGFQVRAASEPLTDLQSERFRAINQYLYYDIPAGANQATLKSEDAPICLALLDTGVERVLLRKVYSGRDLYGRPGNYQIHVVADLPAEFDAVEAILRWDTPLWQATLDDLHPRGTYLPMVTPDALAAGACFARVPRDARLRESLEYVIRAWLTLLPGQRITLAAPPEQVAALVLGLALALPPALRRAITFTTFEQDVRRVDATVIGTCWFPQGAQRVLPGTSSDVPDVAYSEGYALNTYTGRCTPLVEHSRQIAFARFSSDALLSGDCEQLEVLLSIAGKLGVATRDELLLVFELFMEGISGAALTAGDMSTLLRQPVLAAAYLPDGDMQRALARAALDRTWWQASGYPAMRGVLDGDAPAALTRALFELADVAAEEAQAALVAGDVAGATHLFEMVAYALDPEGDAARCTRVVRAMSARVAKPPHLEYSRAVRAWVLNAWLRVDELDDGLLNRWLQVPWGDIGWLLDLPLPEPWRRTAAVNAVLSLDTPSGDLDAWQVVDTHEEVLRDAALFLLRHTPDATPLVNLFRLIWESPALGRTGWLRTFLTSEAVDARVYDAVVSRARPSMAHVHALMEGDAAALVARSRVSGAIVDLLAAYVGSLTVEQLETGSTRNGVRATLAATWLPAATLQRAAAWHAVASILHGERPDPAGLERVRALATAITTEESATLARRLIPALARVVSTREQLAQVLEQLGEPLAGGRWELYTPLFDAAMRRTTADNRAWLFGVYLSDAVDYMAPAAIWSVFRAYLAGLDRPDVVALDAAATGWPVSTRERWGRLHAQRNELSYRS